MKIKLIFVPACGTGIYQPLDRRLFGILKKSLIKNDRNKFLKNPSERWKNIYKEVKDAWEGISEEAILSAWDIPRLNELISDDEDDMESSEEWLPDENE